MMIAAIPTTGRMLTKSVSTISRDTCTTSRSQDRGQSGMVRRRTTYSAVATTHTWSGISTAKNAT